MIATVSKSTFGAANQQKRINVGRLHEALREAWQAMDALRLSCLLLLCVFWMMPPALAQDYPSKAIQMIIPYQTSSSTDVVFRVLAPKLSEYLGKQVIIVNKPGGAATIGMNMVAKSAPDGYTLGVPTLSFAANPQFIAEMPFDTEKDFASVSLISRTPLVLTINSEVPARSVKEFIALAKAKPNSLNYGSAGVASSGHLAGALFASMAGIVMTHVPYSGDQAASPGLAGGQTQVQLASIPSSLPGINSGRAIALAVTTAKRVPTLPNIPTVAEAGVPGFEMYEWAGVLAPAGTPRAIIDKLYQAVVKGVADPATKERIEGLSVQLVGSTPDELERHIKKELATWAKIAVEIKKAETNVK